MQYTSHYQSPLGRILLAADNTGLTGLWSVSYTHLDVYKRQKEETPESLLASVLRSVLAENNPILEKQISETITKQVSQNMSFLLQAKERQEEERYRNLDQLIRQQQLYRKESVRTAPSRFFHRLLGEA